MRRLAPGVTMCLVLLFLIGPAASHADTLTSKKHQLQNATARRQYWAQKLVLAKQEVANLRAQLTQNQQQLDQSNATLTAAERRAWAVRQGLHETQQQRIVALERVQSAVSANRRTFQRKQADLNRQLATDHEQLAKAQRALTSAEAREQDLAGQATVLQAEINQTNSDIAKKNAALQTVLVQVYKLSWTSDLELLLSANSFNSAISRVTMLGRISQFDDAQLRALANERGAVEHSRQVLTTEQAAVEELRSESDNERRLVLLRTQQGQTALQALSDQLTAAEASFKTQASQLNQQIAQLRGQMAVASANEAATAAPLQAVALRLRLEQSRQGGKLRAAQQQAASDRAEMAQAQQDIASLGGTIQRLQQEALRRQQQQAAAAAAARRAHSRVIAAQQPSIPATGNSGIAWPLSGPINQGFGPSAMTGEPSVMWGGRYYLHFHTGIDIGAAWGTPIHAAAAGVVLMSSWYGGYGNCIILAHNRSLTTLYGHMSSFAVHAGQYVGQGQVIGYVGSTGYSTGPHLHFEVRVNGQFQNPFNYLG